MFAAAVAAVAVLVGVGYWATRPPAEPPAVTARQEAPADPAGTGGVANEDVLLIEGGVATSESYMMVTNPPKK